MEREREREREREESKKFNSFIILFSFFSKTNRDYWGL